MCCFVLDISWTTLKSSQLHLLLQLEQVQLPTAVTGSPLVVPLTCHCLPCAPLMLREGLLLGNQWAP